jgi:hypothetical protein
LAILDLQYSSSYGIGLSKNKKLAKIKKFSKNIGENSKILAEIEKFLLFKLHWKNI